MCFYQISRYLFVACSVGILFGLLFTKHFVRPFLNKPLCRERIHTTTRWFTKWVLLSNGRVCLQSTLRSLFPRHTCRFTAYYENCNYPINSETKDILFDYLQQPQRIFQMVLFALANSVSGVLVLEQRWRVDPFSSFDSSSVSIPNYSADPLHCVWIPKNWEDSEVDWVRKLLQISTFFPACCVILEVQ